MSYTPLPLPREYEALLATLQDELDRISDAIALLRKFPELHVAPSKPESGVIYYADGTDWDPGSGKGLYYYDGSSYNLLG